MTHRATSSLWLAILAGITLGCQTAGTQREGAIRSIGTLLSTDEMRNDAFTLHQQLRFFFRDRSGKLDSVIQKGCDSLDVVGPFNSRIFTLRQVDREVVYEPEDLEQWPVPPLRVLFDIHRIYLYPLPNLPPADGVYETEVADMMVSEHWSSGRLWQRVLSSTTGRQPERIKIDYAGGFVRDEAPPSVVLEDERRQYRLEVEIISFRPIACED